MRHWLRCVLVLALCLPAAYSQTMRGAVEREFPFPVPAVKAALDNLGAYTGSRLPSLEGFANLEKINLKDYQRPYYEFKIEIDAQGDHHALVRVRANVSAWYTGPDAAEAGYRTLESNGHLENDLLDRLSDYLRDKSADAATLQQWIATAKQERADTERRTADLQEQLKKLENPQAKDISYVTIDRPHVNVLSEPSDTASVMVNGQMDDEFQVLEHRGAWLGVKVGDGQTGWVRAAQVQSNDALPAMAANPKTKITRVPGFEVIRENTDEFSGDWARLKGKKALYIWARPDGSAMNLPTGSRLQFVQKLFSERYREMVHSSKDATDGIVVIFMDERGGVAAASLDDIRMWVEGTLSQAAFLKRCSLDPPGAFQDVSREAPLKQHARHVSRAQGEAPPGN